MSDTNLKKEKNKELENEIKPKTAKIIVSIIFGLAALSMLWIIMNFVMVFQKINAILIQKGFVEMFSGNQATSYFIWGAVMIIITFLYVSFFFLCFFLMIEKKDLRGNWFWNTIKNIIHEKGRWFFLILTLTISFSLMYTGVLFLTTAFPSEPLFFQGVKGENGSFLKCNGEYGGKPYLNIISNYDLICNYNLSDKFNNAHINNATISYYGNNTPFMEPFRDFSSNQLVLYFDNEKEPSYIRFYFNNSDTEVFNINNVGLYTKKEYYDREKQKVVWFVAIISFSFFSVISAMGTIKEMLRKK